MPASVTVEMGGRKAHHLHFRVTRYLFLISAGCYSAKLNLDAIALGCN